MSTNNPLIASATVQNDSLKIQDLNFRLRLDIGGANLRIEDKIINSGGNWYVDPESGLDIDFDIIKTWNSTPNESTITIWNLNNETYNKIYEEATAFELYGAESDNEYALMFRGYPDKYIKRAKHTLITSNEGFMKQDYKSSFRGQNDLPTVLKLIDGKTSYTDATINKVYYGEVSSSLVFEDVIESMGLVKGNIAQDIQFKNIKNFSARGKSAAVMNYLANLNGFKWTIMNGLFEAYTGNAPEQPYGIMLDGFNSSTPERQDDKFKTKNTVLQKKNKKQGKAGITKTEVIKTEMGYMIETRLLPFLNPGYFCYCDFSFLKGTKFIYKVQHTGNNYGVNCSSKIWVV